MEISAKSISKKSLFKLYFKSFGYGLFIFSILMGVFALFGFETVTWNEEVVTGVGGLTASFILGPLMALGFTCFFWLLGILGLWFNSQFGTVTIAFKQIIDDESKTDV